MILKYFTKEEYIKRMRARGEVAKSRLKSFGPIPDTSDFRKMTNRKLWNNRFKILILSTILVLFGLVLLEGIHVYNSYAAYISASIFIGGGIYYYQSNDRCVICRGDLTADKTTPSCRVCGYIYGSEKRALQMRNESNILKERIDRELTKKHTKEMAELKEFEKRMLKKIGELDKDA